MDTFFVGAAEGTIWPLTVDQGRPRRRCAHPRAPTTRSHAAGSDKDQLWFEFTTSDTTLEFLYTDRFSLSIIDSEPEAAAQVLTWFLGLLPAATLSVVLTESNPTPAPIDIRSGLADLTETLARLSTA